MPAMLAALLILALAFGSDGSTCTPAESDGMQPDFDEEDEPAYAATLVQMAIKLEPNHLAAARPDPGPPHLEQPHLEQPQVGQQPHQLPPSLVQILAQRKEGVMGTTFLFRWLISLAVITAIMLCCYWLVSCLTWLDQDDEKAFRALLETEAAREASASFSSKDGGSSRPSRTLAEVREGMDSEKRRTLSRVLSYDRIKVDEENFQITFNKTLEFEKRHHGDPPTAVFLEQSKAMDLLRDAADILGVYKTATLDIEGHSATPDHKLDNWAHNLALNRSQKVKEALVSLGVEAERLRAVARPGRLGSGRSEVILNITHL